MAGFRTQFLWRLRRPLCQLCHNHRPTVPTSRQLLNKSSHFFALNLIFENMKVKLKSSETRKVNYKKLISIFAAAIKLGQNQNQIFILFKESFSIKITHVN